MNKIIFPKLGTSHITSKSTNWLKSCFREKKRKNIFVGKVAIRNIMRKWFKTRFVSNLPKGNGCTIITEYYLNRINRAVNNNRGLRARKLKNLLKLNCSHRSIC